MPGSDRAETIGRSTVFTLLAELARTVSTSVLTFYLVRVLGPGRYGIYVLALGIGLIAGLFSDFGTSFSASRFVAERRGERAAILPIVRDALRLKLLLGGAMSVALTLLAPTIANRYGEPQLLVPLRLVAVVLFAQNLFGLFTALFLGDGQGLPAGPALRAGGILGDRHGHLAGGTRGRNRRRDLGRAVGFSVASVVGLVALVGILGRDALRSAAAWGHTNRIASYGGTVFLIAASLVMFDQIDVLMLSAFRGSAAAGIFQAPMRLIFLVLLVGQAVSNSVAPRLARVHDDPHVLDALMRSMRLLLVFAGGSVALLTLWANPIVHVVLGDQYHSSVGVLRILGPFVFLG